MIDRNLELYDICVGEHTRYQIPLFDYRGTPTGIDIERVLETGILPAMDVGIPGRDGGQIGAGFIRAPMRVLPRRPGGGRRRLAARGWRVGAVPPDATRVSTPQ